jgi:5'-nucleotidase
VKPTPNRNLRAVLVAAVGAGLMLTPAVVPSAQAAPTEVTIALLNFNDFHGRIEANNTVRFAGTIEAERATYGEANTLLLSAGDSIGASLFASATQADQPTIDVLNALDLKASAVGNHEFDKGFSDLTGRVINGGTNASWDYLGANVYAKGTTNPVLPEYSLQTIDGVTVGVIGVVTQETASLVSPAGISTLDFGDEVDAVNRVAAELKDGNAANGEADVIVAEIHDGATLSSSASVDLAAAKAASPAFTDIVDNTVPAVDVIFNGHTHQTYAWKDGDRAIVQAASYGTNLGKVVLTYNTTSGTVTDAQASVLTRSTAAVADLVAAYPRVAEVNTITNDALAHAALVGGQEIGEISADVTTAFTGGSYVGGVWTGGTRDNRAEESTMGNLVANSLLATLSDADRGGAEIGVVNPGGLRGELYYAKSGAETTDGVVTYAEANTVLPFVNNLWTTTLSGAQLKQTLEEQWQPDGSARPYLALGLSNNVTYTYDPTASRNNRITSVWVNGKLVKATDSFRIGTFSFLTSGGDNFATLAAGSNAKDSGLVDYEAWIDYLKAHKPTAPNFAKPSAALTAASTAKVGDSYTVTVSDLDLTSRGAPQNTSVEVRVGDTLVTTVPISAGAATATFTMPSTEDVTLTALPSNTVVRVPVTTTALATSTSLTVNKTKVPYGTAITATAKVTGTTSGTVKFSVGGLSVTAALANGVATAKLPNTIAVGTHKVVASFIADKAAAASSSAPVTIKVAKANVEVINKAMVKVTSAKKPFSFTVRTKALGEDVWATGTLKTYLHGHLVAKTALTAADKGSQKITIAAKYLKWYGRGSSLTVVTRLTDSATTKDETVKFIRLILV